MNIGDVFMRVLADDKGFAADLTQKTGKAADQAGKAMSANIGAQLKQGFVQGLGIGGGLKVDKLVEKGVRAVIDIFGDAINAARDEEESIAKLDTALKANVQNWNGNRDAIEKVIASRRALAFSDDEQRQSLSLLVAATHDVNAALDIQATAMDLARFKGISLQDASEALTKVEGGQFRILKSLGIQLKKGATQMDALAAVQKVATGQAEAFAQTNRGKLLKAQDDVNEAMERLGAVLLPAVADGMASAADLVITLVDNIGGLVKGIGDVDEALKKYHFTQDDTGKGTDFLGDRTTALGKGIHALADGLTSIIDDQRVFLGFTTKQGIAIEHLNKNYDDSKGASAEYQLGQRKVADVLVDVSDAAIKALIKIRDLTKEQLSDADQLIENYYKPIELREKLLQDRRDIAAAQRAVAAAKAGSVERHEAEATLTAAQRDFDETALALAGTGQMTHHELAGIIADLKKRLKTATGESKKYVQGLIDALQELDGTKATFTVLGQVGFKVQNQPAHSTPHAVGAASGGYRPAGWSGWVGEEGPERLATLPGGGIMVEPTPRLPHIPSMLAHAAPGGMALAGAMGGGGGDTYTVNLLDKMEVTGVRDLGAGLRMLDEQGYIRRRWGRR